ncbi:fimbrial protein [Proteus faecis]|uniref:fimbrial protein n=1 Tax=Proteus faecis TaxID=2050967 RepID=UPI00209BA042
MNIVKKMNKVLWLFFLFTPCFSYADVRLEVTATMINPACNIRSENNSSPLKIGFGSINPKSLKNADTSKNFSLYLSNCNFGNELAIVLNPKGYNTLNYQGRNILATSIEGLGVDFSNVTDDSARSIEISKKERISPKKISSDLYKVDLKAELVNTIPVNELELGKFASTITVAVVYY